MSLEAESRAGPPDTFSGGPDGCVMIEHLPFRKREVIGARARIGLVALSSDYTIEHEFRRIIRQAGVDFYQARIPNSPVITPQSLADMGPRITETTALILPDDRLDVVAFGCTSASMVLGESAVSDHIRKAKPEARATNPISAAIRALEALEVRRIAVLTPYRRDVNEVVLRYLQDRGIDVAAFGSFNEEHDANVAMIDAESIERAIERLIEGRDVGGVFVSCTSLRVADDIARLEKTFGMPVTASNHALAWDCLRLAGVDDKRTDLGRLYTL